MRASDSKAYLRIPTVVLVTASDGVCAVVDASSCGGAADGAGTLCGCQVVALAQVRALAHLRPHHRPCRARVGTVVAALLTVPGLPLCLGYGCPRVTVALLMTPGR